MFPIDFDSLIHLQKNDFISSLRISAVAVILLFVFASAQRPFSILLQAEVMTQQQSKQETSQRVPLGGIAGSNFTNYTNLQYEFSLLYPSGWVNEEIPPGANLTFLMSFSPPPREFGEFVFVYMAIKNLTGNNTSLKQFADQEISLLKRPPAITSPTEDTGARTILDSEPTTIARNTPAYKVAYSEKVSGTLSKIIEIYTVDENRGYILSYLVDTTIYKKYLPTFQKMVRSLNITTS